MGLITDRYAQQLLEQGMEYAVAQDKAFMAKDLTAEATAQGGMDATVKALAAYTNTDQATALEAILMAVSEGREG